jgi:hypothetical protein
VTLSGFKSQHRYRCLVNSPKTNWIQDGELCAAVLNPTDTHSSSSVTRSYYSNAKGTTLFTAPRYVHDETSDYRILLQLHNYIIMIFVFYCIIKLGRGVSGIILNL